MKWSLIVKQNVPSTGTYKSWKAFLAVEAERKCVYCALHDNRLGGERVFHVEHLRPKSKFKNLTNDYGNLFYACPICNTFKSNSWFEVTEGDLNLRHYPDPCKYDYCDFFNIDVSSFSLSGRHPVGAFLIERLHLNRRQLLFERKFFSLNERLRNISSFLDKGIDALVGGEHFDLLTEIARTQNRLSKLLVVENDVPLYEVKDLA